MNIEVKKENVYFGASIVISSVLFFFYYPQSYAFRDEGIYMSTAYLLKKGALFLDGSNIPISYGVNVMGRHAPYYPLGNSILLLVLSFGGWKALFLLGWISHIAGAFLFRKLARLFEAETVPVLVLYIFSPTIIFFSRTLMSDLPALVIFLAACLFYFNPKFSKWIAGFLLGLNLFMRASSAIIALPFIAGMIFNAVRKGRVGSLMAFLGGFALAAIPFALCNHYFYGSPYLTGSSDVLTGIKSFGMEYFRPNLQHYLLSLNVVFPFCLVFGMLYKKIWKLEIGLLVLFSFCFFSAYFFYDRFPSVLATLIFGNRYLLPAQVFLVMGYGIFLDRLIRRLDPTLIRVSYALLLTVLAFTSLIIHSQHDKAVRAQAYQRDLIYQSTENNSALVYTPQASELVQAAWGPRFYYYYRGVETIYQALKEHPQKNIYWVDRPDNICNDVYKTADIYDPPHVLEAGLEMKPVVCEKNVRVMKVMPIEREEMDENHS